MNVEIFALCDAATVSGKLNILGVFDAIKAPAAPVVHNGCSLAARIRFERIEAGEKTLTITIIDEDGKPVLPTLTSTIQVRLRPESTSATAQIVLGISQLTLPHFGEYQIDLAIDGRVEKSIPLFARQQKPPAPANA